MGSTCCAWAPRAALFLFPRCCLKLVIISVQVLAGLMLPSAIIFVLLLLNDDALLGDQWVNKTWNNRVNWTIVVILCEYHWPWQCRSFSPNCFHEI